MKKAKLIATSQIRFVDVSEGERIETKVERITRSNEPIRDNTELFYDSSEYGRSVEKDIRTDRFVLAVDASDKIARSKIAKRLNDKEDGKVVEDNATNTDI